MKKRISLLVIAMLLLCSMLLTSCDLSSIMGGESSGDDTTTPQAAAPTVVSCEKVKTEGLVDTWRITFSDDSTVEYTVTNGAPGADGADGADGVDGEDGKNGAPGAPGAPGASITVKSCEKVKTVGLVDTYRITFSDDSVAEFKVTNGQNGTGGSGTSVTAPTVESCTKVSTNGLIDTWRILFSDGSCAEFTVTNGQNGTGGSGAPAGEEWETLIERVNMIVNAFVKTETIANSTVKDGGESTKAVPNGAAAITGWTCPMTKAVMFGGADKIVKIHLNQFSFHPREAGNALSVGVTTTLNIDIYKSKTELVKRYSVELVTNGTDDYVIELEIPASDLAEIGENDIFILGFNVPVDSTVRVSPSRNDEYKIANETHTDYNLASKPIYSHTFYYTSGSNDKLSVQLAEYAPTNPDITFDCGTREIFDLNASEKEEEEDVDLLQLPAKYDLVVGDTFELFYKGISKCLDSDLYAYELSFLDGKNLGSNYSKKYVYKPVAADIGTHTLKIAVRDNLGQVLDEDTVVLNVVAAPKSPASTKNILVLGDSITAPNLNDGNYTWVQQLYDRLTAAGVTNVNFLGTRDVPGTEVRYEGYGGWGYTTYMSAASGSSYMCYVTVSLTDTEWAQLVRHSVYSQDLGNGKTQLWKIEEIDKANSRLKLICIAANGDISEYCSALPATGGTLAHHSGDTELASFAYTSPAAADRNPLWNTATGKVDFKAYAEAQGAESIDEIVIFLGWNHHNYTPKQFKEAATALIDAIHKDYPSCHVSLVTMTLPSRDGMGKVYGTQWNYFEKMSVVYDFAEVYEDIANSAKYTSFVSVIGLTGQFDAENAYPTDIAGGNIHAPIENAVQSDGVHPTNAGRKQIGDAVYRHLATRLQ